MSKLGQSRACTGRHVCIVACIFVCAILITIGILLIWLVRIPSATVVSTSIRCSSTAQCNSYAESDGIPVLVNVSIHNPNILSAYVQSTDLVLTDRNNQQQLATGSIDRQHIRSLGDSTVVAMFNFPASTETTTVITAVYVEGQNYPININGHLHLSVGALSFTYHLNEDETIPGQ